MHGTLPFSHFHLRCQLFRNAFGAKFKFLYSNYNISINLWSREKVMLYFCSIGQNLYENMCIDAKLNIIKTE